jgi:hypothetical protein
MATILVCVDCSAECAMERPRHKNLRIPDLCPACIAKREGRILKPLKGSRKKSTA